MDAGSKLSVCCMGCRPRLLHLFLIKPPRCLLPDLFSLTLEEVFVLHRDPLLHIVIRDYVITPSQVRPDCRYFIATLANARQNLTDQGRKVDLFYNFIRQVTKLLFGVRGLRKWRCTCSNLDFAVATGFWCHTPFSPPRTLSRDKVALLREKVFPLIIFTYIFLFCKNEYFTHFSLP